QIMPPALLAPPVVAAGHLDDRVVRLVRRDARPPQLLLALLEALALLQVAVHPVERLAVLRRPVVQHLLVERAAAAPALDVALGAADGEDGYPVQREPLAHLDDRVFARPPAPRALELAVRDRLRQPARAPDDDR